MKTSNNIIIYRTVHIATARVHGLVDAIKLLTIHDQLSGGQRC
jgi:hypothetical protein